MAMVGLNSMEFFNISVKEEISKTTFNRACSGRCFFIEVCMRMGLPLHAQNEYSIQESSVPRVSHRYREI